MIEVYIWIGPWFVYEIDSDLRIHYLEANPH